MEIHLDRKLSERRIFPAVDIIRSSSRREDLLLSKQSIETVEKIFNMFAKAKDNIELMESLKKQVIKKQNKE